MKGDRNMNTLNFTAVEEIEIRNEVDRLNSLGVAAPSTEPCKVCSTELLSLVIVTSKGAVQHLSCPCCGERDIRPTLQFK